MDCYGAVRLRESMQEQVGLEFVIYADTRKKCLKGAVDFLKEGWGPYSIADNERIRENKHQICILKSTCVGNSHDESWQDLYYIIDGDAWADKLDEASKEGKVKADMYHDLPDFTRVKDLDDCLTNWATSEWYDTGYEIYTIRRNWRGETFRSLFSLGFIQSEGERSLEGGNDSCSNCVLYDKLVFCLVQRELNEPVG